MFSCGFGHGGVEGGDDAGDISGVGSVSGVGISLWCACDEVMERKVMVIVLMVCSYGGCRIAESGDCWLVLAVGVMTVRLGCNIYSLDWSCL